MNEKILSGREILKKLESEGKYVFHGSEDGSLKTLEPRQAYTFKGKEEVPDGKPAVHASPFTDVAIFMAIINKRNCPKGFSSGFNKTSFVLHASKETLEQLNEGSVGYVYVFSKDEFVFRNDTEVVSYTEVTPLKIVEVKKEDLSDTIEIR